MLAFASISFYSLESSKSIKLDKYFSEAKEGELLAREKLAHEAEQLAKEKKVYEEAKRLAREKQEHEKAKQVTHGDKSPIINNTNHVDKEVAKLKKANIAFNSPSSMKKNETYLINLHLSPNKSTQELLSKIKENEKEAAEIKYSYRMKASLLSENKKAFEIMSISPDIQAVSSILDTTTWKWDVTPLESGKQYLHLSLTAFLDLEDKETPLQIKTFDKEIEVKISVIDEITSFFQDSWKWLLGSLLFPLIVWYWKLKHPEKKS